MKTMQKSSSICTLEVPVPTCSMGFTLLEILVALAMGFIFITALFTLIIHQTKSHEDHQMKVMMQQNGRAALAVIGNDLMLAGYSPVPRDDGGSGRLATFRVAGMTHMDFTFDANADGDIDEKDSAENNIYIERTVLEYFDASNQLGRNNNTNRLLQDVEAFRVLYAYDADDLGAGSGSYGVLEKEADAVRWAYDSTPEDTELKLTHYYTLDAAGKLAGDDVAETPIEGPDPSLDRIRAAKIWLLIRSNKRKAQNTFENQVDFIPDFSVRGLDTANYSYRLYTTTVKFRNMYY
ncbi:PilW family protein [Desulfoluna spongiiphila]|uniref:Type IV Pilus-assembly protein W n=1 Tax=Desulfoluna spongiiphila TaxID=419481 RepID=A0A1G5AKP4_9BACT|nr:PilW family protein [Desulfoluna spongiiphila]SCX78435.1 Type IV Pilus-assembly protein W [Desulfoluna spongiiphila]